ncbi:hypothetical protein Ae201684P_021558 [Aphanomyces euteiches]|nr:hypothetical protein Ae201684P_021558 [Aphanomyces euteiches]
MAEAVFGLSAQSTMIAAMNYVPSCMWDELCLLLATDEGLHDEMNTVCDILEGDSPDEASDTASPSKAQHGFHSTTPPATPTLRPTKPRKRPHFDVRQRQEMILLRREVDILRKHLSASQTKVKRPLEMTKWEKAAKSECMEKNRSIQENEQLKEAVHQQATLIQQMEKLCNKKMRLTDDAEAWQNYRLAAHESLRVAAIHAIADRQFEVEPLPSHPTTHCSLTCVVQMTVDPTAALNVPAIDVQAALETFMQQMSLTVDTYEPKTGTFHIATKSLEHLAVPHPIHFSLDRGRMFLTALEDEINRAVRLDNHLPLTS